MSESATSNDNSSSAGAGPAQPIPFMQRLLDNPFALLFAGVVTPAVFYVIWGILEVAQIPIAQ